MTGAAEVAVALAALHRARAVVNALDESRTADDIARAVAGVKHEIDTARKALSGPLAALNGHGETQVWKPCVEGAAST